MRKKIISACMAIVVALAPISSQAHGVDAVQVQVLKISHHQMFDPSRQCYLARIWYYYDHLIRFYDADTCADLWRLGPAELDVGTSYGDVLVENNID